MQRHGPEEFKEQSLPPAKLALIGSKHSLAKCHYLSALLSWWHQQNSLQFWILSLLTSKALSSWGGLCTPLPYICITQHNCWASSELALGWGRKCLRQFVNNSMEDRLFLIYFKICRSSFFPGALWSSILAKRCNSMIQWKLNGGQIFEFITLHFCDSYLPPALQRETQTFPCKK